MNSLIIKKKVFSLNKIKVLYKKLFQKEKIFNKDKEEKRSVSIVWLLWKPKEMK
jgi:hypothetical protein